MASTQPSDHDVAAVIAFLHEQELVHLRARRRADLLTIESGDDNDPIPHARLRRVGVHVWTLEMPTHRGTWERTPIRGQRDDVLRELTASFSWILAPLE